MSADEPEGQSVRFSVTEARIMRGALNVVCEILSRPGLAIPPGIPISRDREPLFDELAVLLRNRIEASRAREGFFTEALTPAEAQALRDVVGALQTMLEDRAGRQILVRVGFLVNAEQMVEPREIEELEDLLNRIDPTGVRSVPTDLATSQTDVELIMRIDRLRSELAAVRPVTTEDELDRAIDALLPHSSADCGLLLVSLAELAQVAYQVAIAEDDVPQRRFTAMKQTVEHNRRLILNKMGFELDVVDEPIPGPQRNCLGRETFNELRDSFISILDPIPDDPEAADTRAFAAISDIRNAFQDPRRGGASDVITGP